VITIPENERYIPCHFFAKKTHVGRLAKKMTRISETTGQKYDKRDGINYTGTEKILIRKK